jgi:hypothetical protein
VKIIMILATGVLLTFPAEKYKAFDCHDQGYNILEKIATYHGPGPDQAWILNNSIVEVAGWYCH